MKQLLLSAAALCVLAAPAFAADPNIDPKLLSEHIKVLSSDAFEGRGPNTPGETKSVAYISQQFKAVGLQPGGDKTKAGRAWTQNVPLAQFDIKGPLTFTAKAGGKTLSWKQGDEIAIRAPQTGVDRIDFSADETYLIASCEFSGQMVKVDLKSERVVGTLNLPDGGNGMPQDVKLSPDGKVFYVADMHANGLWKIDGRRSVSE